MKRVFIICSVKDADEELRKKLTEYAEHLESQGCTVHLPHRDTAQDDPTGGCNIMNVNVDKILDANEIHIFYDHDSHGSKADIGTVWACIRLYERSFKGLKKKILLSNRDEVEDRPGKNHFKALCHYVDTVQNKQ